MFRSLYGYDSGEPQSRSSRPAEAADDQSPSQAELKRELAELKRRIDALND
jgi:hypothetical protein